MKFKISIKVLPVVMLPIIVACNPQKISQSNNALSPSLSPEIITWLEQQPTKPPTFLVIAKDNSLSTIEHHTPPLTLEQLQPILANISTYGGEIAFLGICGDYSEPALRLELPSPPLSTKNDFQLLVEPNLPDYDSMNAFKVSEARERFDIESAEYRAGLAKNDEILLKKKQELKQWQASANQQVEEFKVDLEPKLNREANCQQTDIYSTITRTNLISNEERVNWSKSPKKYALYVTDGLHDADGQPVELTEDVELLLVNGSGSTGIFAERKHKQFESLSGAVNYLIQPTHSKKSSK